MADSDQNPPTTSSPSPSPSSTATTTTLYSSNNGDPSTSTSTHVQEEETETRQEEREREQEVQRERGEGGEDQENQQREQEEQHRRVVYVPNTIQYTHEWSNDAWSCLIVLATFWFFASVTLILGLYGSSSLQLGPYCSELLEANSLFVKEIQVEELSGPKRGMMLYGFSKMPSLDVDITWSKRHKAHLQPNYHKEWVYFLNEGSQVDVNYSVDSRSSYSPLFLIIAEGKESLVEWIEDPSYPNLTLSWNIITGNGSVQQKIYTSDYYYVAVGNLNQEDVEVILFYFSSLSIHPEDSPFDGFAHDKDSLTHLKTAQHFTQDGLSPRSNENQRATGSGSGGEESEDFLRMGFRPSPSVIENQRAAMGDDLVIIHKQLFHIQVQLSVTIQALVYNTTTAYTKCSLENGACGLNIAFLGSTVAVLTSPGPDLDATNDDWSVKLSYEPRWIFYLVGSGVVTVLILLVFKFCAKFQADSFTPRFQANEQGSERAPLLTHKDDDLSSWGSSYDSVSHDEDDLEDLATVSEAKMPLKDGENGPRRLCVICCDAPRDCFFLPCGHCAACFTCGARIVEEGGNCPVCRRKMKKVRKIFAV